MRKFGLLKAALFIKLVLLWLKKINQSDSDYTFATGFQAASDYSATFLTAQIWSSLLSLLKTLTSVGLSIGLNGSQTSECDSSTSIGNHNRNMFNKMRYSTYSYLLTTENIQNKLVLLLKINSTHVHLSNAGETKVAFGELYCVLLYLGSCHLVESTTG